MPVGNYVEQNIILIYLSNLFATQIPVTLSSSQQLYTVYIRLKLEIDNK